MEKTNLYFIGSIKLGAVKIGISKDPSKRLSELQTGNPHKLTLFCIIHDIDPEREQTYHWIHRDIRLNGEWFELTDDLIRYMVVHNTTISPTISKRIDYNELLIKTREDRLKLENAE